ncbi:Cthe_2314 family HEPN domain-containing protein [Paenibacillus camelliae]|uniref:Cthe_2314 family HEPN domain-containing protein n=1 Tax=Paenibacillus camelliae TaxID=512410 RepID=UPI002042059B|nr:Cthe_2314 family HEPN domain-containing protein [Paenibacillus camelliae]
MMLQFLYLEDSITPDPLFIEADQLLQRYAAAASAKRNESEEANKRWSKFEIWSLGLRSSLHELYSSHYAAKKYKEMITSSTLAEMDETQKLNYTRYVYFDKNGFIRVFSLLDKLGTFLNELLEMRTERVKPHFSYFTVLRRMRESGVHPDLTKPLNDLKESSKEPTHRLRRRRNTEIHYMNSEMHDDLVQQTRMYGQETEIKLENLDLQLQDLTAGLHMVTQSILLTFQYAERIMKQK